MRIIDFSELENMEYFILTHTEYFYTNLYYLIIKKNDLFKYFFFIH